VPALSKASEGRGTTFWRLDGLRVRGVRVGAEHGESRKSLESTDEGEEMILKNLLPKNPEHAPVTPGQRDELLTVRWGARKITLRSADGGANYVGATGEDGLILIVRRGVQGLVARIEDRKQQNSWASPSPKLSPQIAVASLHREIKRLSRAGGV